MDWFQIGNGVPQGCILSPFLFNLYAEYIMWNARLNEAQAGINIAGRNISDLRYADDTTLTAESKEKLKSLLMKMKEESEKAGLKFSVQKMKIMASSPITLWQIEGETVETMTDFIFLGSKITADGECSHEIKRCLLLGRKVMTNLDSILKNRDITLPTKVSLVKAMVSPVVVYGSESWTIKKTECQRIDANCGVGEDSWESLVRISNKSILNIHWKDWCWSWSSNTLATWWEELTDWKRPWCWERLKSGGEGNDKGWDGWMASPTQWTWIWASSGRWWRAGKPGVQQSMGSQRGGEADTTEQLVLSSSRSAHSDHSTTSRWQLWWRDSLAFPCKQSSTIHQILYLLSFLYVFYLLMTAPWLYTAPWLSATLGSLDLFQYLISLRLWKLLLWSHHHPSQHEWSDVLHSFSDVFLSSSFPHTWSFW